MEYCTSWIQYQYTIGVTVSLALYTVVYNGRTGYLGTAQYTIELLYMYLDIVHRNTSTLHLGTEL